jgi:DNA replication protein DnaC
MSSEQKGGARPMWEQIDQEMAGVSFEAPKETKGSPEAKSEELFALWQDYRRLRIQVHVDKRQARKEVPAEEYNSFVSPNEARLNRLRQELATRWADPRVQTLFKQNVDRATKEWSGVKPGLKGYKEVERTHVQHVAEREKLYQEVFKHRDKDPDELTQIEIAGLSGEIKGEETKLEQLEKQSPDLAARLSFERLANYRKQMAQDGFMWTPSREKYFRKIVDHLVVVNQNRPMLLSGETGTGKTRLARAVSKRLTGKAPYEVGEEAKTDIRPLLGKQALDHQGDFVRYGQLGQALTGKETSRDTEAKSGGIFYMDEMNGYPPDALRSLVKQISGRRSGEEVTFAAWAGKKEKLSHNFGFLGSANLASEKHPDRADLPVEVARELTDLEIDYPPQTADDPELYEMMLAALMDQNSRIRLAMEELAPEYTDKVDNTITEKHKELNLAPGSGGTLWRFANLVADIQKSYKGEDNSLTPDEQDASYLRAAVLDPGLALSWLQAYRKVASRQQIDLQSFLGEKLESWATQKTYPEEDRNLLGKFVDKFNLKKPPQTLNYRQKILSPLEIGALSPRVPREAVILENAPVPSEAIAYLADNSEVMFNPDTKNPASGSRWTKKRDRNKSPWVFKGFGLGEDSGQAVLEDERGETISISQGEFVNEWEALSLVFSERFENKEIKLDILEVRQESQKFYFDHNFPEFAANLPSDIKFSPQGEARIREAMKMGFDSAMILPGTTLLKQSINKLGEELADKKLPGMAANNANQIKEDAYFESDTKGSVPRNRPAGKAYMVMYQSKPVPQETKGKTPNDLDRLFAQKKWDGMTLEEYLLLQRKEAEARKDHSFDEYSDDEQKSQWTWLLDSRTKDGYVVRADWDPGDRQVVVSWHFPDSSSSELGARPAVVVEIL